MFAMTYSRTNSGILSELVIVEVHISNGLPRISIVGLPEKAVKESKDRVRSALLNMNFNFPARRLTINLAPADLPKEGGRFDLAIAIGILAASNQIPKQNLAQYEFVGELALSGELRPVKGILPFALATKKSGKKLILPKANAKEAGLINELTIVPAEHFIEVIEHLTGKQLLANYPFSTSNSVSEDFQDLSDVMGQSQAKRALEIAAAGGHSILMIGPPGTGKTMLAKRLPSILPTMTEQQALEVATIASVSNKGFDYKDWRKRPFRSPHHSSSSVALVGGGRPLRPGEISLAHNGILFLDELPEFNRNVLEALREPLEAGYITISRAAEKVNFPADFQLISAMNPCPCGYFADSKHSCYCSPEQINRYFRKISGPILDRIDMHVSVARISSDLLLDKNQHNEPSNLVSLRVTKARQIQQQRNSINAKLDNQLLASCCQLTKKQKNIIKSYMQKLNLSARSYHRVLKIARTIADLSESDKLQDNHLIEALSYRYFDNQMINKKP